MTNNIPFKTATRDAEAIKREELIKMLSDVSKKLYLRITAQRFRAKESDPTLLAFTRAFSQCSQALTSALRDQDLSELERRIDALENNTESKERELVYE